MGREKYKYFCSVQMVQWFRKCLLLNRLNDFVLNEICVCIFKLLWIVSVHGLPFQKALLQIQEH